MKRVFALVLTLSLLLTGCGGAASSDGAASGGEKELRDMTLVLDWYPNALHGFLYQAVEKGYFAEEGIRLHLQPPAGVSDALSMVAAGKVELGLYYQQHVIQARAEQNAPVKSIAAVMQGPLNIILSLKEKNITSPADLVGKKVGYAGGVTTEALVRSIMEHEGYSADDVTMTDVGWDLMSSMTTGNVDATIGCMVNHEVPQMEKEGFEVNYFMPDEYGVPKTYEGIFIANDEMIENEPELLAGFLRACERGFRDFQENTEEVVDLLLKNQDEANFALDRDVEMKSAEILLPIMETADAPFLSQTAASWQENIDWMLKEGLIEHEVKPEDVMAEIEF